MTSDDPKGVRPRQRPHVIAVPDLLVHKAGGLDADPASAARVQARLDALTARYPDMAQPDYDTLAALWPRLCEGGTAEDGETFRRLVHDFKGQGGSVGYPLVSEIARLLNELLHEADPGAERTRQAIDQHVAALGAVLRGRISGDGGAEGKALCARLQALVETCLGG
jgi:HPt (histidine-containing phosphotransfer) domain-containing protein